MNEPWHRSGHSDCFQTLRNKTIYTCGSNIKSEIIKFNSVGEDSNELVATVYVAVRF